MSKKILVVEDDELSQFVIVEMCRELGFDCNTALNGQEAIDILSDDGDTIGVVLMDIHMPIVSGLAATKAVRSFAADPPRSIPIVATTADVNWYDKALCRAHGFDSVLAKPLTLENLSDTLRQYVGQV